MKRKQLESQIEPEEMLESEKKEKMKYNKLRKEMRKLNLHPELLAHIGGPSQADDAYNRTDKYINRNILGSSEYYREVLLLNSIKKVTNFKRNSIIKPVGMVLTKSRTKSLLSSSKQNSP